MIIKKLPVLLFALMLATSAFGQKKKYQKDVKAIKDMCGCYEVEFKYTETFAPEVDYEKAYDYTSEGLELAKVIEERKGFISIQHLLIVKGRIIKHWRQDWTFEDPKTFTYLKNNEWSFEQLDKKQVKGKWTQKVYQVDDSPRYAGTGTWVHYDGKNYWESTADSPLPRREYTKRDDYNVMRRGNRHEITDYGWVHEQDNKKIQRDDKSEETLIAEEKGFNTYTKVGDEKCQKALKYWDENKEFWAMVNQKWDEVYDRTGSLKIKKEVDEKPLFMHLIPSDEMNDKKDVERVFAQFIEE